MQLDVLSDYRNDARGVAYKAGQVIEVDVATAAFLMADSPESFAEHKEKPAPNKRAEPKEK